MKMANNAIIKTVTKHGGEMVRYLSKNSPTILTGCAVAGAFAAVALAVKGTKPALRHIDEAKIEHRDRIIIVDGDKREDMELTQEEVDSIQLKPLEVVQACWKDYIPTAIALAGTTACVIGAHSISAKRTAAMAALYTMSEQALKDYKDKAVEIVGKGKAEKIEDATLKEQLDRHPRDPNMPMELGRGDVWCYERMTDRYFASNADKIRRAVAEMKVMTAAGERVSRNDFYYALGMNAVEFGDEEGWCVENDLEVEFRSSLMSDGTPVLAIEYKNKPTAWYYD